MPDISVVQNKVRDEAVNGWGDVKYEFTTFKKISRPWFMIWQEN